MKLEQDVGSGCRSGSWNYSLIACATRVLGIFNEEVLKWSLTMPGPVGFPVSMGEQIGKGKNLFRTTLERTGVN